jgi:hypothetical protein
METNEKLTSILRGRTIELVSKEEGSVVIVFDDNSSLRLKVAGGPTLNMLGEGKIESVAEEGTEIVLLAEDGRIAILPLAELGSSVSLTNATGDVEYAG